MSMKKTLVCLVSIMAGVIMYAQTFELGLIAGSSVNLSCLADVGADMAMVISTSGGFDFGLGTGLRFASPISRITMDDTKNSAEVVSRVYSGDLTLPLFVRFRYRFPANLFVQSDVGYRFGLLSVLYGTGWAPSNSKKSMFSGVLIEPQVGFHISDRSSLSFGMTLQRYARGEAHRYSVAYSSNYTYETVDRWSPIAFIKFNIALPSRPL